MFLVRKRNFSMNRFFTNQKYMYVWKETTDNNYFWGYIFYVYLPIVRTFDTSK